MSLGRGPKSVFIASSKEGLDQANELHDELEKSLELQVSIWDDTFELSDLVIERLLNIAEVYDYAIVVFTPDDYTISRKRKSPSPRDNLNLETGIFLGKLGRKYTIVVRPDDNIKMPSDLAGFCCVHYDHEGYQQGRCDMKSVANKIRHHIQKTGYRSKLKNFMSCWGYGKKQKAFAAQLDEHLLVPFANGKTALLLGCFGGEESSRTFETNRIALSELWPIPTEIPANPTLSVDCSVFAGSLKKSDHVYGVLFLVPNGINLKSVRKMDDIVSMGGRVLAGNGCQVGT